MWTIDHNCIYVKCQLYQVWIVYILYIYMHTHENIHPQLIHDYIPCSHPPLPPHGMGGVWCPCGGVYKYIHTYIPTYLHTYVHTYIHTITLPYLTLPYLTLHYLTLHSIHTYIHAIPLHYITLPYLTLHYLTLPYIPYIHAYIHTYIHTNIPTYQHTTTTGHRGGDQKNHTTTTGHRGGGPEEPYHHHRPQGGGGVANAAPYICIHMKIYIHNWYMITLIPGENETSGAQSATWGWNSGAHGHAISYISRTTWG